MEHHHKELVKLVAVMPVNQDQQMQELPTQVVEVVQVEVFKQELVVLV